MCDCVHLTLDWYASPLQESSFLVRLLYIGEDYSTLPRKIAPLYFYKTKIYGSWLLPPPPPPHHLFKVPLEVFHIDTITAQNIRIKNRFQSRYENC